MIWQPYQLGSDVSKSPENITLWRTEKGIIEIGENTLAIPVKLGDREKGYVFHGPGKLLLDTIVETEKGAIGKSVEQELNELFLMLGDTEEIRKHLANTSDEDFKKMGYENRQVFLDKAEDFCDQFFRKRKLHSDRCFDRGYGFIFAFQNQTGKFDILVAKGARLVYKAMDMVFVSNRNKVVLKSASEIVCTGHGKSVIIKK